MSVVLKEEAVTVGVSEPEFSERPVCAMSPRERVQMDTVQLSESWWNARSESGGGSAPLTGSFQSPADLGSFADGWLGLLKATQAIRMVCEVSRPSGRATMR